MAKERVRYFKKAELKQFAEDNMTVRVRLPGGGSAIPPALKKNELVKLAVRFLTDVKPFKRVYIEAKEVWLVEPIDQVVATVFGTGG